MFNFRNFVSVVLFSSSFAISAAPPCEKWMAKLISAQGQVDKQLLGQAEWHKVKEKKMIFFAKVTQFVPESIVG